MIPKIACIGSRVIPAAASGKRAAIETGRSPERLSKTLNLSDFVAA
jgi:hypothetical protein